MLQENAREVGIETGCHVYSQRGMIMGSSLPRASSITIVVKARGEGCKRPTLPLPVLMPTYSDRQCIANVAHFLISLQDKVSWRPNFNKTRCPSDAKNSRTPVLQKTKPVVVNKTEKGEVHVSDNQSWNSCRKVASDHELTFDSAIEPTKNYCCLQTKGNNSVRQTRPAEQA